MSWYPHVTVASIVEKNGRFLLVKEKDDSGSTVFNQPAGHLEQNESLIECAVRETLEESGWHIEPVAVLSLRLYTSPNNNVTYLRTNIIAKPLGQSEDVELDPEILDVHWLSPMEIKKFSGNLRSPLVLEAVDDYLSGTRYPLNLLDSKLSASIL